MIEFHLPDGFGFLKKKVYKVDAALLLVDVIDLICLRHGSCFDALNFDLRTAAGLVLDRTKSLSFYGLGTIFLNWQLQVVPHVSFEVRLLRLEYPS